MIEKAFDLNSPLWRMMGFLSDMMLLTIIWFVFSIPIVTIGPATLAMFKVCNIQLKGRDQGVLKNFYYSFITYLKKMTIPGLVSLFITIMLVTSVFFYHSVNNDISTFLLFVSLFSLLVYLSFLSYALPLAALLDADLKEVLKLSFFLSIYKLKWTFLIVITNLSVIFLSTYVAPYISLFSISSLVMLNTRVVMYIYEESLLEIQDLE